MKVCLAALLILLPSLAQAQAQARCHAQVNGIEALVEFDPGSQAARGVTSREAALRGPGRLWHWAWGDEPTCSSGVLIDQLGSELPPEELAGYCLAWVDETGSFVLLPGERNFRGRCTGAACRVVNASTGQVAAATAGIARLAGGAGEADGGREGGLTAVAHRTGALILQGSAGSVAGALGSAGAVLGGLAPAALAAGAVTVVVGGGALFVCSG